VLGKLPHQHQRDTHGDIGEYESRCVRRLVGGGCSDATPICTVALTQPIRADKRWTYRRLRPAISLS